MKRTTLAIVATLACTIFIDMASAQSAAASSPSGTLDRFTGDRTCTGQIMAMGKDPGYATTGKLHVERTLDGHWVVAHYEEDQIATNPKPGKIVNYVGYDPETKQFISVVLANGDGAADTGVSSGWKGNSITFDLSLPGNSSRHVAYRDTFTYGEAGMLRHTGWMRDKHGKWVKTDEETCRKA